MSVKSDADLLPAGEGGTGAGQAQAAAAGPPDVPAPGAPSAPASPRSGRSGAAGPFWARTLARLSGPAGSLLLHGLVALLAWLTLAAAQTGRGGGTVGTPHPGAEDGTHGSATLVPREASVEPEARTSDVRVYAEPPAPEAGAPDLVPPETPEDFLKEQEDARTPLPMPARTRDRELQGHGEAAYARLPSPPVDPGDAAPGDGPSGSAGRGPRGDSNVAGVGGDTGGAGEGTSEALYTPSPVYPAWARRRNIEGIVVVEVEVEPDGHCEKAWVRRSSGCDALDQAAQQALTRWRYEPHPDQPPRLKTVRFVFKLQQ